MNQFYLGARRRMLEKLGFKEVSRIGKEEYLGKDDQLIQYTYNNRTNFE